MRSPTFSTLLAILSAVASSQSADLAGHDVNATPSNRKTASHPSTLQYSTRDYKEQRDPELVRQEFRQCGALGIDFLQDGNGARPPFYISAGMTEDRGSVAMVSPSAFKAIKAVVLDPASGSYFAAKQGFHTIWCETHEALITGDLAGKTLVETYPTKIFIGKNGILKIAAIIRADFANHHLKPPYFVSIFEDRVDAQSRSGERPAPQEPENAS